MRSPVERHTKFVTPRSRPTAGSNACLRTGDVPVPLHLKVADPRQRQAPVSNRPSRVPVQAAIATPRAKARIAGLLTGLHAAKKGLERPVQATQRVAHSVATHLWRTLARGPKLGHIPTLGNVSNPPARSPGVATLLQRGIV